LLAVGAILCVGSAALTHMAARRDADAQISQLRPGVWPLLLASGLVVFASVGATVSLFWE
jgi:hypothetical protein